MSGHDDGNEDERRSLLGEFSVAHKREFEIPSDRDFEQTIKSQMEMEAHRLFEENNLDQRRDAELDDIGHDHENIPSYGLSYDSSSDINDRYEDIMARYESDQVQQNVKYINIRDNIREDGVTLTDEFKKPKEPSSELPQTFETDLEQLGIDTAYEFNNNADIDYYGRDMGNEFVEIGYGDDEYSSHYEEDFTASYNGNDNNGNDGNDGNNGGRSM